MTADQFADLQEGLMIVFGNLSSWWLILLLAGSIVMAIIMAGLGLARILFSKRVGIPQNYNPLP